MGEEQRHIKDVPGKPARRFMSPFLRISLLLGVCLHLVGFLVFRVVSVPLPERVDQGAFVQFVSAERLSSGEALEEQAALFDTAPLFIPGRWNAAHNLRAPFRDLALQRFPFYEPEIDVLAKLQPERSLVGEVYDVMEPADLLALRFWDLFSRLGQRELPIPEIEPIGPFAEVRDVRGRLLQTMPVDLQGLAGQALEPAVFILRMEAEGRLVSSPSIYQPSQDEAFDALAHAWLRDARNTVGLPAGLLTIAIYP
ncbi:MAG: hypothetical protein EA353_07685 [Puniceicoccaceae bacterium]|nr:MAG: hypothetical protein EA353_07685 [Puniceicoccaceae bacterium]